MKRAFLLPLALAGVVFAAQAQDVKGDAKAGEKKIAMCIGCHGIPGYQSSFPQVHRVPMIAGQGEKYVAAALVAYRKGERKHPTMRGIAASMSDQDIADVAAFYGADGTGAAPADTPPAPPADVAALLQKGACASCHGPNFNKPIDGSYPKLAGQHGDYLFVALKSYKPSGSDVVGRGNAIMGGIVQQFSNAELKALASYMASLPGEMRTNPQSRFR